MMLHMSEGESENRYIITNILKKKASNILDL